MKASLEKGGTASSDGIIKIVESNKVDMAHLHRWKDPKNYNITLIHYMALYYKGHALIKYFSGLPKTEFQDFLRSKESFGSTFLHSAVGRNNVEFLQHVFAEVGIYIKISKNLN